MNPEQTNQIPKSKKTGIFIAIGVIVILALVVFFAERGSSTPTTSTENPTSAPLESTNPTAADNNPPATTSEQTSSAYKDGTYTATGSYMSPGGPDKVGLSVTLADGIITDATFTPMPGDPESAHYQNLFASGCKQLILGKNIDSVHLTVVSGSSLTSTGFNDALNQIKAQAKA